ncbi:hypothetical protein V8F06_003699 [Rhypophila decipiens]
MGPSATLWPNKDAAKTAIARVGTVHRPATPTLPAVFGVIAQWPMLTDCPAPKLFVVISSVRNWTLARGEEARPRSRFRWAAASPIASDLINKLSHILPAAVYARQADIQVTEVQRGIRNRKKNYRPAPPFESGLLWPFWHDLLAPAPPEHYPAHNLQRWRLNEFWNPSKSFLTQAHIWLPQAGKWQTLVQSIQRNSIRAKEKERTSVCTRETRGETIYLGSLLESASTICTPGSEYHSAVYTAASVPLSTGHRDVQATVLPPLPPRSLARTTRAPRFLFPLPLSPGPAIHSSLLHPNPAMRCWFCLDRADGRAVFVHNRVDLLACFGVR